MPEQLHTLYRFYGFDGALLYVGITQNPSRRFEKHKGEKSWWSEISRIELEQHPTRDALATAEREAIKTEKPHYNDRLNDFRPRIVELVWKCDVCGEPVDDGDGYLTANYRIRTQAQVLHWTAHLFEKRWIHDTNWATVVRRAAGEIA